MFGLMRAKKCGMSPEEKHFRRLNYCGTCKTIGTLYGQKSRLLLNHDTVFLAEVLTAVGDENVRDWQKSYQSFNCLNLPKDSMPIPLKFAATANMILTEFKIADHVKDSRQRRFKFAGRVFSKEFLEAEKLLETWNFPLEKVREILETQDAREAAHESLESLSWPTAQTTALFFSEGVKLIGKNQLENSAFEIGFAFGKLIYLLDAFEDYEKDFTKNQFNAVRSAFGLKDGKISAETKRKVVSILHELENEIIAKIYALPIAENQKAVFASRLSDNLKAKLKTNLPVLKTKKACSPKPKQTFSPKRWQKASEKARNLARNYSWQMPLVFLFVFAFAFIAPAQSREAKSARECFDLSFNLMTLGAVFGSILAFPKSILQNPEELLTQKGRKRKAQEEGGSDSGDGWCDACDCCCCCDCDGC